MYRMGTLVIRNEHMYSDMISQMMTSIFHNLPEMWVSIMKGLKHLNTVIYFSNKVFFMTEN